MKFSIVSVLAFVAAAVAQQSTNANAFNLPSGTLVFNAGQSKQLTWSNPQGSTVTLVLRTGSNSDLKTVSTIADHIQNTGSFTWTPDASLPEGSDYAIEIINNDSPSEINYTQQFVIMSDVKAVASGSSTGVVTATSASLVTSMPTAPATGSTSGASAATTGSSSGSASGMTTKTGSASASSSGSATGSSSRTAASATSASGSSSGSVPTNNAASRPVMGAAGGLLAVAAGFAIAL